MIKKYVSSSLALILVLGPQVGFAQIVDESAQAVADPAPIVEETVVLPVPDAPSAPVVDTTPIDPSQPSTSPQSTDIDQTTADSSIIEATVDPSQASDPVDTTPLPASTDPIVIDVPIVPVPDPDQSVAPVSVVPPVIDPVADPVVQVVPEEPAPVVEIPEAVLVPEEKYLFELNGQAIATKEKRKGAPQITATPNLSPDASGELDISGSCTDPYFVVLVYAKQDDYSTNPSSYIFNKAFDCVGGSYSYSLKDLPPSLRDGTYFLLIGAQGNSGTWKPITALTPITIKKEIFYDEQ